MIDFKHCSNCGTLKRFEQFNVTLARNGRQCGAICIDCIKRIERRNATAAAAEKARKDRRDDGGVEILKHQYWTVTKFNIKAALKGL